MFRQRDHWQEQPQRYSAGVDRRTISLFSQDLITRFRNVLTEYGALTEVLDRSLVRRLLKRDFVDKTPRELLGEFEHIDRKARRLTKLGLLTVVEDIVGEKATGRELLDLVTNRTDIFTLYVNDRQQKLALFDRLEEKLETFRSLADRRLQFKRLVIDPDVGFLFESNVGTHISASDLSSGEQHEIILLYELLFLAQPGDLVLIDEPELSLHIEWQLAFLEDLRSVIKTSNIDILMATHSPAIARNAASGLVALGPQRG